MFDFRVIRTSLVNWGDNLTAWILDSKRGRKKERNKQRKTNKQKMKQRKQQQQTNRETKKERKRNESKIKRVQNYFSPVTNEAFPTWQWQVQST